jgi:transglutaminase-like putative cysteine protease
MPDKFDLLRCSLNLAYLALLGSIVTIAGYVAIIPLVIFLAAFFWGILADNQKLTWATPRPIIVFLVIFISILISLIGISLEGLFDRILGILLIMISAKIIMPKKQRDVLQIYLLNLFVIASAALIRFGIEFGILVMAETYISITGLILIYGSLKQREINTPDLRSVFRFSGIMTLILIPAAITFFIIIPRPTWTLFSWDGGAQGKTGFSERVRPGDVEELKRDRSPAFRVKWLRGPRPVAPRWRGLVYDTYRNGGWEKSNTDRVDYPVRRNRIMEYEILLEPSGLKYLPALGVPVNVSLQNERANLIRGYTITVSRTVEQRILYHVWAINPRYIPEAGDPKRYLRVPPEIGQAMISITSGFSSANAQTAAREIVSYLKTRFTYTLKPGAGGGGHPVIRFLTVSKQGHCEYFATAMVFMLRSLGFPARMVGGYLGGEWNETGEYYLVNQSDAHTWVEVWVKGKGWLLFDPTPNVGPIDKPVLLSKLNQYLDYVRYKWYCWVMQYDLEKQIKLARQAVSFLRTIKTKKGLEGLGIRAPDKKWLIPLMVISILFVGAKIGYSYLRKRPRTAVQKFILAFHNKGFEKHRGETIKEFIDRMEIKGTNLKETASQFVHYYYLQEYKGEEQDKRLNELVVQIQKELSDNAASGHGMRKS